ncbi:MAG: hypothetical protein ABF990_08595 [Acetobacter sp.]|uniref:hypothetical protein n=1 Tax=Acetobacter sp. TaxID=440 RepID=UPI0039EC39F8
MDHCATATLPPPEAAWCRQDAALLRQVFRVPYCQMYCISSRLISARPGFMGWSFGRTLLYRDRGGVVASWSRCRITRF